MTSLRWGILATGGIAETFTTDLLSNGFTVKAVGSRSLEKAKAFAERHGISRAHATYEALAEDSEVDAIYVANPHTFHAESAALAIRSGKHVLIEKPVTINAKEATYLRELASRHDVVVMEAMWTRFLPHMVRIREILGQVMLGEIRAVTATHTQAITDDPTHRLNDLALGGGALLDLGIYPISFTFDVLGPPDKVIATGRLRDTGADAEVSVNLRYASGATALALAASDTAGPNTAVIQGTDGYVEIDGVWFTPTTFRRYDSQKTLVEEFPLAEFRGRGMHFQALEVERLVSSGQRASTVMPFAESISIMEVMDDIRSQIGVVYPGERF